MKVPAPVAKIFDVGDIFGKDGKPDTETLMTHFKNEGRVSEAAAIRVSFTSPSSITTACVQIHWTSCVAIFSLSSSPFQPSLYPQTIYNPLFPLLSFLPHTYALLFLTPALLSLFALLSFFSAKLHIYRFCKRRLQSCGRRRMCSRFLHQSQSLVIFMDSSLTWSNSSQLAAIQQRPDTCSWAIM